MIHDGVEHTEIVTGFNCSITERGEGVNRIGGYLIFIVFWLNLFFDIKGSSVQIRGMSVCAWGRHHPNHRGEITKNRFAIQTLINNTAVLPSALLLITLVP